MKTYQVTTYGEDGFTVSLDDDGIVDVDGLLPTTAENLKLAVNRHMERRGLAPVAALALAVGSYSQMKEVETKA